ncbi:MAG: glucosaminidase domain-containing protein [Bacteroidota bacterium]
MEKSKYDIPFTFVDARVSASKETTFDAGQEAPSQHKELQPVQEAAEMVAAQPKSIPFEKILEDLLIIIQHLSRQLLIRINQFFRSRSIRFNKIKLPWFKIGIVVLAAYVMLSKDMQFNIALRAPSTAFTDDRDQGTGTAIAQNVAHTAAISGERHNPYAPTAADNLKDRKAKAFIRKYAQMAKDEMKAYGVPASIKMAQALVESNAGNSLLAKNNNNHFGIKCFSKRCKKGHCTNAYDDHHKDFFRKYANAKDSWRAHSLLLSKGRYKKLHRYGKSYERWAKGLKEVGYATDKAYAQKLINVIRKYQLHLLDQ